MTPPDYTPGTFCAVCLLMVTSRTPLRVIREDGYSDRYHDPWWLIHDLTAPVPDMPGVTPSPVQSIVTMDGRRVLMYAATTVEGTARCVDHITTRIVP